MVGSAVTVSFSSATSLTLCSIVLAVAGLGMGFVSIATLLLVQNSVDISNLGIVTASHQFTRTLGGTIGIGISGSLVTVTFLNALEKVMSFDLRQKIDPALFAQIQQNVENIFRPEIQTLLSPDVHQAPAGSRRPRRHADVLGIPAIVDCLSCVLYNVAAFRLARDCGQTLPG